MHERSFRTAEKADAMLARVEAGQFDTIFLSALIYGHVFFDSSLMDKHPDVEPDYDPLAYVIEQAHERGIAVHAWIDAGPMSFNGEPGPVLVEHPEWAMMGPEGQQINWLNYTRPDVRQFISDLVLELVTNYDVDGIHFDYTRYPRSQFGFDPYSADLFAEEYGLDLETLRYPELPAYARFEGNPLIWPNTAQVLAEFDNGQPAVLLNHYGAGQAILLNWMASQRETVATSEILDRSIDYLLGKDGGLYIFRSEANTGSYAADAFDAGFAWLEDLGWQPTAIEEKDLATLGPGSVLVLPQVYSIGGQFASDLDSFVHQGGGVIFIDGPTPSIWNKHVRAITGMNMRYRHLKRTGLLTATQEHEIIPVSSQVLPLDAYQALDAQWKTFREQGINQLLQGVYQRVKQADPEVVVSITVYHDQERLSEQDLLDWQAWLDGGYVDLIVPRAYVGLNQSLAGVIKDWQPAMKDSGRIALGLKVHDEGKKGSPSKTTRKILSEIATARASGSEGFVLFDIEHISDDLLDALSAGSLSPSSTPSD